MSPERPSNGARKRELNALSRFTALCEFCTFQAQQKALSATGADGFFVDSSVSF